MKLNKIDIFLVVVIVSSLGFIAANIGLFSKENRQDLTYDSSKVTKPTERLTVADQVNAPRGHGSIQSIIGEIQFKKSDWQKGSSFLEPYFADLSTACQGNLLQDIRAYPIYLSELTPGFASGKNRILIENGTGCLASGKELRIYRVGKLPNEPYLQSIGSAKVEKIAEIPLAKFNFDFASKLGISEARFRQINSNYRFLKSGRVVFVQIDKVVPDAPTGPPMSPPRFSVLRADKVVKWAQAQKKVIVVDVRSAAETQKLPVSFRPTSLPTEVLNFPYETTEKSAVFDWKRTLKQVNSDRFLASKLVSRIGESQGAQPVILIVGENEQDGRPIWAMSRLFPYGALKVFWFADGVDQLNAAR